MIAIILGTRPEIIKMSPIIRQLIARKLDFFILHTNQHYSIGMDKVFFEELDLPQPKYNLDVHDLPQGAMVGQMLLGLEPILIKENPDWVLVEGDTNTVMAGAIAASKLRIKLGHVEAGLRSYDRAMPEELNRIVSDHLADMLYCPTSIQANIAIGEGIPKERITVTGNTIADALTYIQPKLGDIKLPFNLSSNQYLLATLHRQENVDDPTKLTTHLRNLSKLSLELRLALILPLHPRTKKLIRKSSIDIGSIKMVEPLGYLAFTKLLSCAKFVLTDSGGIQEEACIMRIPCLTIRENTERPETVEIGSNKIVGSDYDLITQAIAYFESRKNDWDHPYGDGKTALRILDSL